MIYTIGFTRTTAEHFFQRLRDAGVGLLLDIRLNNRSQLAGFAKYPDIQWFVKELCGAEYIHDDFFAPTEEILKAYQRHNIDWAQYEIRFDNLMARRNIKAYIQKHYAQYMDRPLCLLCSEPTPEQCHRRLVAEQFRLAFGGEMVHL